MLFIQTAVFGCHSLKKRMVMEAGYLLNKKGRWEVPFYRRVYGRFLSIISSKAPTTATAIIIATPKPMTYISVFDVGVGVGEGVTSGAGSAAKLVSADDGQNDSEPANVAMTV
jgi:hypothetical protein